MPTLLSDPPLVPLVGLAVTGLVVALLGVVFARVLRDEKSWRAAGRVMAGVGGAVFLLMLAWFVCGLCLESPREESVRRVNEMAAAVTAKDWAKFADGVSESFQKGQMKKADLKGYFEQGKVLNLRAVAWDFALTDPPRVTDSEVVIRFEGKAETDRGEPLVRHFEATFVKDPDGKFRMKTYRAFNFVQKKQPADFP